MNNAERASNFLVAFGNEEGGIEEFSDSFADHVSNVIPLKEFGTIVFFRDKSVLVRVPRLGVTTLLFSGKIEEVISDLADWAIENNRIGELANAMKNAVEATQSHRS